MIRVEDFSFRYRGGARLAVSGVSLQVAAGSFVGITGAAGSGKTTLARAMGGIVPHCFEGDFYGSVSVGGLDTCAARLVDVSRLVGSVLQDAESQFTAEVVEDEVLFGPENFGFSREGMSERVARALACVGISDLRHRAISSLSGGQKQRVALASVLAAEPAALVCDAPTSELDSASSREVFELLRRICRERAAAVVVVEQDVALLAEYADELVVMEEGRMALSGPPADVLVRFDELERCGVACPRSTALMERLRAAGAYSGRAVRDVPEAQAVLLPLLERGAA